MYGLHVSAITAHYKINFDKNVEVLKVTSYTLIVRYHKY